MSFAIDRMLVLAVALGLDLLLGDPQNPLHPIRLVGNAISLGVRRFQAAPPRTARGQYAMGAALSLTVIVAFSAATWLMTWAAYRLNHLFGLAFEAVACYFLLAAKSLKVESMKVCSALMAGDLDAARLDLSMIVSRDTAELDGPGLVRGAVETVAENFTDGVLAPLIYIALGGAPLGMAFKAVSTLDSMIGYKTDEFLHFGRFAARLDDAANYLPARLSAALMIAASRLVGADAAGAARIHARDRRNHASPNSAQAISACAGALGIQLGGEASYHGRLVAKPTIGDPVEEPAPRHIAAANRLMYASTLLGAALCLAGCLAAGAASGLVGGWLG